MLLTHDNFIENLFKTFPEFKDSLDMETLELIHDNPIVTFSFFVQFFHKNLGNKEFEGKLGKMLDEMNNNEDLQAVVADFFLNIYCLKMEKKVDINPFLNGLSEPTKQCYYLNVELWERGNGIIP